MASAEAKAARSARFGVSLSAAGAYSAGRVAAAPSDANQAGEHMHNQGEDGAREAEAAHTTACASARAESTEDVMRKQLAKRESGGKTSGGGGRGGSDDGAERRVGGAIAAGSGADLRSRLQPKERALSGRGGGGAARHGRGIGKRPSAGSAKAPDLRSKLSQGRR
mmetsp:Transcript_35965/g.83994  ORF Transcript_35965/g.83994 Transcript_35965/m.83994 type:complete len:166 (-) Transcript_35965:230-727(-)